MNGFELITEKCDLNYKDIDALIAWAYHHRISLLSPDDFESIADIIEAFENQYIMQYTGDEADWWRLFLTTEVSDYYKKE